MKLRKNIPESILIAATTMLQQYCPELSPLNLVNALEEYGENPETKVKKTSSIMTRKEACAMLRVSLSTLIRMMDDGKIRYTKIGTKSIRIDEDSVLALLDPDKK